MSICIFSILYEKRVTAQFKKIRRAVSSQYSNDNAGNGTFCEDGHIFILTSRENSKKSKLYKDESIVTSCMAQFFYDTSAAIMHLVFCLFDTRRNWEDIYFPWYVVHIAKLMVSNLICWKKSILYKGQNILWKDSIDHIKLSLHF